MEGSTRGPQSPPIFIRIICAGGEGRDGKEKKGLGQEGEDVGCREPWAGADPFTHATNVS